MSEPLRKPKKRIRLERPPENKPSDDGHSWAVSYADFLMVLLSFFILFFSIDGNKRSDLIDQIKMGGEKPGGAGARGLAVTTTERASLPSGLSDHLGSVDGFIVERGDSARHLAIYFDDNIYKPGKLDLPNDQKAKLLGILEQLKPYLADINITFIGHTDSVVLTKSKNKFVSDNFALSSPRATKALQSVAAAGYDPSSMYAKGAAEFSRGSRTLSLVITPREVEQ